MAKTAVRKPPVARKKATQKRSKEPLGDISWARRLGNITLRYKAEDKSEEDMDFALEHILTEGFYRNDFARPDVYAEKMIALALQEFGPRISPEGQERLGVVVGRRYYPLDPDTRFNDVEAIGFVKTAKGTKWGVVVRDLKTGEAFHEDLYEFTQSYLNFGDGTSIVEVLPEIPESDITEVEGVGGQTFLIHRPSGLVGKSQPNLALSLSNHHEAAYKDLQRQVKEWTPPPSVTDIVNAALVKITKPDALSPQRWEYAKAGVRMLAERINQEVAVRRNA